MPNHIYFRIAGYTATLAMHAANSVDVLARIQRSDEPEVIEFGKLQIKFITIWTLILQLIYASLGLTCDLLTLSKKDVKVNKQLDGFRNIFFSALLWPYCNFVFLSFWPLALYDVNLVFPSFVDKILSPVNNHVLHTAIVPVAVWELMFKPAVRPKSHFRNLTYLLMFSTVYLYVLFTTYQTQGIWLYPVLKLVYGTIYFPIFFIAVIFLLLFTYYIQWPIASLIWIKKEMKRKL